MNNYVEDKEKRIKNTDSSLLSLDKKLETNNISSHDIVVNKFKMLKPEIRFEKNENFMKNLHNFMTEFKESTNNLIQDEKLQSEKKIENIRTDYNNNKSNKYIEMDLGLGIFDIKDKGDNYMSTDNDSEQLMNKVLGKSDEQDDLINENIIKFLLKKKKKSKQNKRIHLKNNINK
jgi:hypothetical protein